VSDAQNQCVVGLKEMPEYCRVLNRMLLQAESVGSIKPATFGPKSKVLNRYTARDIILLQNDMRQCWIRIVYEKYNTTVSRVLIDIECFNIYYVYNICLAFLYVMFMRYVWLSVLI